MAYLPNNDLYGVAVDLDSGTVMDIASIVYVSAERWDQIRLPFEDGQMSDNDIIDFAGLFGEPFWVSA